MPHSVSPSLILSSLKAYLAALEESGVSGFNTGSDGAPEECALPLEQPPLAAPRPVAPEPNVSTPSSPESLEKIRRDLGDCQRCKLGKARKNLVFGIGNEHARLVFVGEGPGGDEDLQGEPFVGEAGRMLNRIIAAMGLKREDVYICNVVKCRPPGNRDPETDEISACAPFLLRQVQSIKPEVIVALGKFAAQTLLKTKEPISRLRGNFRNFYDIPLMPTYHPSFLLHRQAENNMEAFWQVWDDMTQVLRLLKLPVPEKSRKR